MILVTVNGEDRELSDGATISELVRALGASPDGRGLAVAVEGEVVLRAAWEHTELKPGARVEVLIAVQGG